MSNKLRAQRIAHILKNGGAVDTERVIAVLEAVAANKPESQAQAGEPMPVWNFGSDRENENCTVIVTILGAHRPKTTDQFITLQSHREAMAEARSYVEFLDASIAKKDAALRACVEALKTCEMVEGVTGWEYLYDIQKVEDALTQALEAL